MKILYKFALINFLKSCGSCIIVFLILFILGETFRILNIPNKPNGALMYSLLYIFYQIPYWITQILPISGLLGFLFFYTNISVSNEIIAIKASGINLNKIFLPILIFMFFMSIIIVISNEVFLTDFMKKGKDILYYKLKRRDKQNYHNVYTNVNYIGENNKKYIIKFYYPNKKTIVGINIDRFDDNMNLVEQIYAKRAIFIGGGNWKFFDGIIRKFDNSGNVNFEEKFVDKIIDIHENAETFKIEDIKFSQITIKKLKKFIEKLKKNSLPIDEELTELYNKISFPFVNFIFILLGMVFVPKNLKNNRIIGFSIGAFMLFLYWGTISVFLSLGMNGIINPCIAAWGANIFYFILSIIVIKFKN